MVKDKYLKQVSTIIKPFSREKQTRFFLFGSSLVQDRFGDLDIGVIGEVGEEIVGTIKEQLENSNLPYFVDVINFNKVSEDFKNNVFNHKILWLTS